MYPVRYNREALAKQIEDQGVTVKYYRAFLCSCNLDDGHPDADCDCQDGYRYETEVEQKMQRTQINVKYSPELAGLKQHGGVIFTVASVFSDLTDNPIWDKLHIRDIFVTEDRRLTYDRMKKGVRDTLASFDPIEIYRILYNNSVVPAEQYELDTETGLLTFADICDIPDGGLYLVEFYENTNYIVASELPQKRGSTVDKLPRKVAAVPRNYQLGLSDFQGLESFYD